MSNQPRISSNQYYQEGTDKIKKYLVDTASQIIGVQRFEQRFGVTTEDARTDKEVSTRILVGCAELIANDTHAAALIPKTVFDNLEDVISKRRKVNSLFSVACSAIPGAKKTLEAHIYFAEQVLGSIKQVLVEGERYYRSSARVEVANNHHSFATPIQRFKALEIEMPPEADEVLDPPTTTDVGDNSPEIPDTKQRIDPEKLHRILLAVCCHLSKLQELSSEVLTHTWKRYSSNKASLAMASLITNVAYDLQQQECSLFELVEFDNLPDASTENCPNARVLSTLLAIYRAKEQPYLELNAQEDSAAFHELYNAAQQLFMPAIRVYFNYWMDRDDAGYEKFLRQNDALPAYGSPISMESSELLELDSDNDAAQIRYFYKYKELAGPYIIRDYHNIATRLLGSNPDVLVEEDILTKRISSSIHNKQASTADPFGLDLLLDSIVQLKGEPDRPVENLETMAQFCKESIEEYKQHSNAQDVPRLDQVWELANSVTEVPDQTEDLMARGADEESARKLQAILERVSPIVTMASSFRNNPVLAGFVGYRMLIGLRESAAASVHHLRATKCGIYLYKVLRLGNFLKRPWEDAEYILKLHRNHIIDLTESKNPWKAFSESFNKKMAGRQHNFLEPSHLMTLLRRHAFEGAPKSLRELKLHLIEALNEKGFKSAKATAAEHEEAIEDYTSNLCMDNVNNRNAKIPSAQRRKSSKVQRKPKRRRINCVHTVNYEPVADATPSELIAILVELLDEEHADFDMHFNYLQFYQTSRLFVDKAVDICQDLMPLEYHESPFQYVAAFIRCLEQTEGLRQKMCEELAKSVQERISDQGRACLDAAEAVSGMSCPFEI